MNPFAKLEESVPYEYVLFPKSETSNFDFAAFDQEFSKEPSAEGFVHFMNFKNEPDEKPVVRLAAFQNFKDVISPSEA